MKSTGEVSLRGRTGYWVVLNMGDTVLYWVEGFSQITLSGLSQDQLLEAAESLQPLTPALTISQAAAQVSFPILTIDAQNAPFPLEWQSARIYPDMDTPVVLQTFLRDGAEIRLQQRSLNGQALALPQVENVPVTVRGVQGYLVGRFLLHTLIWEEQGVDIALSGELSQEEILALAEALTPAQTAVLPGPFDCTKMYPGLPGCAVDAVQLAGQVIFSDTRLNSGGTTTLVNLPTGSIHSLGEAAGHMLGWSPSGQYFLMLYGGGAVDVYNTTLGHRSYQSLSQSRIEPFWLPQGAVQAWNPNSLANGITDWLALPTDAGGLDAVGFPTGERVSLLPDAKG
jgi:hypothetical protein